MKKKPTIPGKEVHFALKVEPGNQVYVAGTFNDWNPTANQMQDNPDSGHYKTTLRLWPGRYEYKFIVNGEWRMDPNCKEWATNDRGCLNSVLNL